MSDALLRSTVQDLRDTAPTLRTAAASLEATGPGTANRATLISGLRDTANGLEEVAGLYWLRDGITKTNSALKPIAEDQAVATDACGTTADLLRATAPELRGAATLLRAGPGTVTERPTLISGLDDAANGLEEVAGLYWLREGLTKTSNALKAALDGREVSAETLEANSLLLQQTAPKLRTAADALTARSGTSARPTLISGLRESADGLVQLAGVYSGLYWMGNALAMTQNALKPIVDGQDISPETIQATTKLLRETAPLLRAVAIELSAYEPKTSESETMIAGLRDSANGLEEIAGLYWLRDGLTKTQNALKPVVEGQVVTTEACRATAAELRATAPELRAAANALVASGPGTSARPTLIAGLRDSANGLEEIAGLYWLRDGLTQTYNALKPIVDRQDISPDGLEATTQMLRDSASELRAAATALDIPESGTSARPTLISGLRDSANGLEEIAGLYRLRDGLTKTRNALQPIVDGDVVTTETCRATAQMLNNGAQQLRATADALGTEPGTSARPTLISGLRESANGLEEIAGLYWLRDGLTRTRNALQPVVDGQDLSPEDIQATIQHLRAGAPELRAAANALVATGPGTANRPTLVSGLRDSANGLEELAGMYTALYRLRDGLTKTRNALQPIVDGQEISRETLQATTMLLRDTAPRCALPPSSWRLMSRRRPQVRPWSPGFARAPTAWKRSPASTG